ncbi:hypothetical protein GORHZ_063_00060 [Gordonia rhizosphera NBRC 16068]|uniref:Uncharacterized protein n=1 Tax=Gordonia rhizosphera NBRC 16068 TaxID=1108045 RepID=K6WBD3_9ACTN|nr:hypothetical protein GORHZ_063_00060 [Gordonia rhizosphera NBRC 16068]
MGATTVGTGDRAGSVAIGSVAIGSGWPRLRCDARSEPVGTHPAGSRSCTATVGHPVTAAPGPVGIAVIDPPSTADRSTVDPLTANRSPASPVRPAPIGRSRGRTAVRPAPALRSWRGHDADLERRSGHRATAGSRW